MRKTCKKSLRGRKFAIVLSLKKELRGCNCWKIPLKGGYTGCITFSNETQDE